MKWDEKVILSKEDKEIAYLRQLPLTEEKMEKICKQFGVTYNISNDVVFIKTEFSSWIVINFLTALYDELIMNMDADKTM